MAKLNIYVGRENRTLIYLYEDGALVEENVVTRAVFRFGPYCVDTDVVADSDVISFSATKQAVILKLGLIPDLNPGRTYTGYLTIYDATIEDGIAWSDFEVRTYSWPVCDI